MPKATQHVFDRFLKATQAANFCLTKTPVAGSLKGVIYETRLIVKWTSWHHDGLQCKHEYVISGKSPVDVLQRYLDEPKGTL